MTITNIRPTLNILVKTVVLIFSYLFKIYIMEEKMEDKHNILSTISPSIVEWTQNIVGKGLSLPHDIISEMWTPSSHVFILYIV